MVVLLQWQPIIEDRQFVRWMVKPASEDERMRARRLNPQQVGPTTAAMTASQHALHVLSPAIAFWWNLVLAL